MRTVIHLLFISLAWGTHAADLGSIQQQYEAAQSAYDKADEALPDTPEGEQNRERLSNQFRNRQAELFATALTIAKRDPGSADAFAALEWILTIHGSYYLPAGKAAMEWMAAHHANNPNVGRTIAWVGYYTPPPAAQSHRAALALIRAVAEKNTNRVARAQALMALAWQAKKKFAEAEEKKSGRANTLAAEAEKAFAEIAEHYADCPRLMKAGQRTLGEEAEQELFALRRLRIGKQAPDIEGEDLNGVPLKLSDYRGRVTVLVFWASWCGPCMEMVPHERALVERKRNQPFALVGVNGDPDRNKAKQVTKKESMTWRSFWNGRDGPQGPISRAWNVRSWPTVYVLDQEGVIRAKDRFDQNLDKVVDELLQAAPPREK